MFTQHQLFALCTSKPTLIWRRIQHISIILCAYFFLSLFVYLFVAGLVSFCYIPRDRAHRPNRVHKHHHTHIEIHKRKTSPNLLIKSRRGVAHSKANHVRRQSHGYVPRTSHPSIQERALHGWLRLLLCWGWWDIERRRFGIRPLYTPPCVFVLCLCVREGRPVTSRPFTSRGRVEHDVILFKMRVAFASLESSADT